MVVLKISGRRTLGYGKYMLNKVDWLGFKLHNLDLLNQEFTIKIRMFWASNYRSFFICIHNRILLREKPNANITSDAFFRPRIDVHNLRKVLP